MSKKYGNIIFTARYVLPVTSPVIKNGAVYVKDGIIQDVGKAGRLSRMYKADVFELGRGILMPGFINAHTHLEYGSAQSRLEPGDDFPAWILEILKNRLVLTKKKAGMSVKKGIDALIKSGVVAVGEISTFGIDRQYLSDAPLYTVLFKEVTSVNKLAANLYTRTRNMEERPFLHAPYSTSSEAYMQASVQFRTYGTHIAESIDEYNFVTGRKNNFEKRLPLLIRKKPMMKSSRSPVDYINKLGFLNRKATLVHFVHVDKSDVELAASHDAGIVLCPRSNAYLGTGLPNVELLRDYPRLGLGTDGLSSNYSLDMIDEVRFLYLISRPILKAKAEAFVINAATIGGARALFIEDRLGSIEKGKLAGLIYLDTDVAKNLCLSMINTPSSQIRNLYGGDNAHSHL